ncbi:hypothetical protein [Sphingomonas sp.]|uniref:hypothetical protein n=1 Tax=Sphingomonas sp. TaxID=28214 RepID=UPI002E10FABA
MIVWIRTVPSEERLACFLADLPRPDARAVEQSARQLRRAFDQLIERGPPNVALDAYLDSIEPKLRARFPWMSTEAFGCLSSYAHWMNWHG